jgi:ABC-type transport system involved in cytochrome c biogenesis permease subunit
VSSRAGHLDPAERSRLNALVWFGVLGGPVAWAVQFLLAMQIGLARCESPDARFQLPVHAWAIGLAAAGVLVGALAGVASLAVFRATRHAAPDDVPAGRLHFLGAIGMTVNPLTVTLCAMTGIAIPLLGLCHQS